MELAANKSTPLQPVMVGSSNNAGHETVGVFSVVVVVPSSAIAPAEVVFLVASSGEEHAARKISSRMDSENKTERVCFPNLSNEIKDDRTIPSHREVPVFYFSQNFRIYCCFKVFKKTESLNC